MRINVRLVLLAALDSPKSSVEAQAQQNNCGCCLRRLEKGDEDSVAVFIVIFSSELVPSLVQADLHC